MPVQDVQCPVCKEVMQKRNIPQGIEVDFCNQHGVWLDVGELEAVAAQARSGAVQDSSGGESLVKTVGKGLGRSAVFGAGATVGHRIVSSLIDSVFG